MELKASEMDIISNCPLCEEHSLHLIKDGIDTQQCINCGYATSSKFKLNGTEYTENNHYKTLSTEMKGWSKVSGDFIWIPSFITLPIGMIFPISDTTDKGTKMVWGYAKLVDIPEDEREKYPIENADDKFYEQKYDTDNANIFDTFLEALHDLNETIKANQR
tara:strand:+ start:929 stop:1414 length:486 start_codon:yes stop_codon:yes gene_type:complete